MLKYSSFLLLILLACKAPKNRSIYLGQGCIVGEVSTHSALLQARFTQSDTLIQGDMPGIQGTGDFEISTDPEFEQVLKYLPVEALPENDFIVKAQLTGLEPDTRYYYRLRYKEKGDLFELLGKKGSFRTLAGPDIQTETSFVVVTGMNHYHFHYGKYDSTQAYAGADKALGYPALEAIKQKAPDYFIGTGDNVYFDHPNERGYNNALKKGKGPHPGGYEGKEVKDEQGMRRKYHEQFSQPRFKELFRELGTYWEKDDHDYRFNDADPYGDFPISHELGIKNFREQMPVVDPDDPTANTYRTHRVSMDLQLWFVEGRDYRSSNKQEDGAEKTLWGKEQLAWLKASLLASDATYKLLVSPTALVGPDDAYKKDNHVNHQGFRHEGEAFFNWLTEHEFLKKNFYILCGDRHWQYHAEHPSGFEEFSCGALVDNNSRAGRLAGDPKSTDPDALIKQHYIQGTADKASGGFLLVSVKVDQGVPGLFFQFYDEQGSLLYEVKK